MKNIIILKKPKFYLLTLIGGFMFFLFSCQKEELIIPQEDMLKVSSELSSKNDKMYQILDPNFESALIAKGYDDAPADGQILKETVLSITDLDVSSSGISNLSGIEYFVNLIKLNCSNNNLTILDLGKNKALEILICNTNQLKILDVRKNKDLKVLHSNHNQLESLDISKNTLLEELFCNHNKLESIDLSNNKMLIQLYLNHNMLTSLDISENSVLERLLCNANKLEGLDLSNNNSLIFFRCNNNNISCIQVNQEQLDNPPSGWPGSHGGDNHGSGEEPGGHDSGDDNGSGEEPDGHDSGDDHGSAGQNGNGGQNGGHDDGGTDEGHDGGEDDGSSKFIYSLNCNE